MICRACVQLPLDLDGIYTRFDTKGLKTTHIPLVHLTALENRRNPDIFILKKERAEICSEYWTERFKEKFLCYANAVLFEIVKKYLKDTHLGVTNPTALKNEVSTFRQIYYDKKTRVMVNQ